MGLREFLRNSAPDPVEAELVLPDDNETVLQKTRLSRGFAGEMTWCASVVDIELMLDDEESDEPTADRAYEVFVQMNIDELELLGDLVNFIADKKLDLACQWQHREVEREEFIISLMMQAATIYNDGSWEFIFSDGGLLLGYSVQVTGNVNDGPCKVELFR